MDNERVIADVIDDLSDMEDDVREAAKKELIAIGEPAIPQLIEALAENLWDVPDQAADILAEIGEATVPVHLWKNWQ